MTSGVPARRHVTYASRSAPLAGREPPPRHQKYAQVLTGDVRTRNAAKSQKRAILDTTLSALLDAVRGDMRRAVAVTSWLAERRVKRGKDATAGQGRVP